MKHINHSNENIFNLAILIKEQALNENAIQNTYINPLHSLGFNTNQIVSFSLEYQSKKQSVTNQKIYLDKLLPEIDKLGITELLVCDGEYFKTLTKQRTSEPHYGYVMPCKYPNFEHMNVILCSNHQVLFVKPDLKDKINLSLQALTDYSNGSYVDPGKGIIHSATYPKSLKEIEDALSKLHDYPSITADIETFSLKHYTAGIGTISFAWDQHNGIAFNVDNNILTEPNIINKKSSRYSKEVDNLPVKKLLREFFEKYEGEVIYHNGTFDMAILAFELWMREV
tara:strand:+ start:27300 stop:28148 length:849 start_codon:yes stop_codon:yes gene_type:complete